MARTFNVKNGCRLLFLFALLNPLEVLAGSIPGLDSSSNSRSLELVIELDRASYKLSEPVHLQLIVRNAGKNDATFFKPNSIHQINPDWALRCQMTRPDGQKLTLEPDITFQMAAFYRKDNFITLHPGRSVSFNADLGDNNMYHAVKNPWVAIVDSWSHSENAIKGNNLYVRKVKMIKGEYVIISGLDEQLAVKDFTKDVFTAAGFYSLVCECANNVDYFLEPNSDGFMQRAQFPGTWVGTLKSSHTIEVLK